MANFRDLGGAAQKLLDLFVEQLPKFEIEVPETRFVAPGSTIAWDGECLAITLGRIEQGQPGAPQPGSMFRPTFYVTFNVALVRSVPGLFGDGQPGPAMIPSTEDQAAAGVSFFGDAAALALAAAAIHEAYTFSDPQEGFEIVGVTPIGPQGGLAGNQVSIAVSVS